MKKKYRIIKSTTVDGAGNTTERYTIEKKIWWWWVPAKIDTGNTLHKLHGGSSDIMLKKKIFTFHSQKNAKEMLEKYLVNPPTLNYKGSRIIRVFEDFECKDVYVNLSMITEYYATTPCYEYAYDLDKLKLQIDRRIQKTKKTIVKIS